MLPLKAPLPTARYLPFQPDAGIQTSILMSESLDGFSVAATRQNAGRSRKACAAAGLGALPPTCAGRVNPPATIASTRANIAGGRGRDARVLHDRVPAAVR